MTIAGGICMILNGVPLIVAENVKAGIMEKAERSFIGVASAAVTMNR